MMNESFFIVFISEVKLEDYKNRIDVKALFVVFLVLIPGRKRSITTEQDMNVWMLSRKRPKLATNATTERLQYA
jgi:hypothetical protein